MSRLQCIDCPLRSTEDSDEYAYRWTCLWNNESLGVEDEFGCDYLKTVIDREQFCSLTDTQLDKLLWMFQLERDIR